MLGTVVATNKKGQSFLKKKSKETGVTTLPSGLMYKVVKKGHGKFHPKKDSQCELRYVGYLSDGKAFDDKYLDEDSSTTFAPDAMIKGFTEAMQLMVEGDKWELYVPSELAFGDGGAADIVPGGAALRFTMDLIKIIG